MNNYQSFHFANRKRNSLFGAAKIFFTLFILSAFSSFNFAAELSKPDVRIVVDISGSMKQNDPNNLRIPAVKMLIGMLPDGATAGVWTFGRYVNMLVPHKQVTDQWRNQARNNVKKINSVAQFTHIESALLKAGYDNSNGKKHENTHVILLTDGQVDLSKNTDVNKESRLKIIREVAKEYGDAGIKIHTVALSNQADHLLLERISLATGGISTVAGDADQLMQMFLQVLDQAAPQDQLPITGNVFQIDSSVEEATVLLFRKNTGQPTRLTDPDGRVWQSDKLSRQMKWFEDEKFDLITITKPTNGEWVIGSDQHQDNRVSVVSDLKMRVDGLPAIILPEEPLKMSVFFLEKERLLNDPQFLDLIDITIQIDRNGAKLGAAKVTDFPMVDGKYQVRLRSLGKFASYAILIEADGKTFSRKFQRIFKIAPPPPEDPELDEIFTQSAPEPVAELMEHPVTIAIASVGTPEDQGYDLELRIEDPTISTDSTQVISMVASPDGSTFIGTVDVLSKDLWQIKFRADQLPSLGEYKIQFSFSGEQTGGKKFEYKPEPLSIVHPDDWVDPAPKPVDLGGPEEASLDEETDDPVEGVEEILLDKIEEEPFVDEPTAESEVESQEQAAWYDNGWLIGSLIVLFNLLVIGGGYVAYQKFVKEGSGQPKPEPTSEPGDSKLDTGSENQQRSVDLAPEEGILDQLFDDDETEEGNSAENEEIQELLDAVDEELVSEQPEIETSADGEVGIVEEIEDPNPVDQNPVAETLLEDEKPDAVAPEKSNEALDDIDALMAEFNEGDAQSKSDLSDAPAEPTPEIAAEGESDDIDALIAEFGADDEIDDAAPAEEGAVADSKGEASSEAESSPSSSSEEEPEKEPVDDDFEVVGFDEDLSDDPK